MFHLLLGLILIFIAQGSQAQGSRQPNAPKAPAAIQVPYREVAEHLPEEKFPSLRVPAAADILFASIPVETTVDAGGNVVAAKALAHGSNLKLPAEIFDQAEILVKGLHFRPFERGGRPVLVKFECHVSLLPPELKPAKHVPFPRVKDWKSLKITLERTGCFGSCPGYKVEVHGDGTVLYRGGGYVAFTGQHRGLVSVEKVIELVKLFERADYFSLRNEYRCGVTDSPTYTTAIAFDGFRKQIVDYVGLQIGMPMAVADLEASIDRLSGSERWIKGNGDTLAALQAEHWDFKSSAAATTLARVAQKGNADVVRDLVSAGVPLNGEINAGFTDPGGSPLEVAAVRGDIAMLRALLNAGAAADPARLADATVSAVQSGKVEGLRLLLENGAVIGARDSAGRTVLMAAAASGSPAMVKEALSKHAEVNASANPAPLPCREETKRNGNCGEDGRTAVDGRTALMEAVSHGDYDSPAEGVDRVEVVRFLLAAGADVNARDKAGNTALILCHSNLEQALLLLTVGADPNARNLKGATALSDTYNDDMKRLLIKHGAVQTAKGEEPK